MCGIVGYIGTKNAYPILMEGLKRLEYRGYDSAGIAMIDEQGKLNLYKWELRTVWGVGYKFAVPDENE